MIFRSQLPAQESDGAERPAFEAIAEIQKSAALTGWYVTQPDHARISGELAAAFDPRKVPNVNEAIVRAISMHDIGWMPYEGDVNSPRAAKTARIRACRSPLPTLNRSCFCLPGPDRSRRRKAPARSEGCW